MSTAATGDRLATLSSAILLASAAALLQLPAAASAVEKPRVSVRFEIAVPSYRADLTNEEIRFVEQRAAQALVTRLTREFAFLSFQLDEAPLLLSARLEPRDQRSFPETGLRIRLLRGPDRLGDRDGAWWTFRPAEEFGIRGPGTKEVFLREIELKLDHADYAQLMRSALDEVTIASAAELLRENAAIDPRGKITGFLGWRIPFVCRELCIEGGSVLLVEHTVPLPVVGPTRLEFRAKAFRRDAEPGLDPLGLPVMGEALPDQDHLEALINAPVDAIRIRGVRVLEYKRLAEDVQCGTPVTPSTVRFDDGKEDGS
jgi:hypothetical protein